MTKKNDEKKFRYCPKFMKYNYYANVLLKNKKRIDYVEKVVLI